MRLIWVGEFLEWRWPVSNMATPGTWFGSVLEMVEEADSENQNCDSGWDQAAKEVLFLIHYLPLVATPEQRLPMFSESVRRKIGSDGLSCGLAPTSL